VESRAGWVLSSGRSLGLLRVGPQQEGRFDHAWLAVSPDEESLPYSQRFRGTSELMLVENFRRGRVG
jgi:hypothetical protein